MHFLLLSLMILLQAPTAQQTQNGSATGQIRSRDGEPLEGIRIAAIVMPEPNAPAGNAAMASLTETDTTGRYRLQNIPPGRYYIQAGLLDAPTYFPGVASIAAAGSILISAGAVIEGLDFTVVHAQGFKVSGRIPVVNGQPVQVTMRGRFGPSTAATAGADGSFEFLRVVPGEYTLNAFSPSGLPPLTVVVRDTDVIVGMRQATGVKVRGVVGLGPSSQRVANQRVTLTGATAWIHANSPIDALGRFEFPNVPAGYYTVRTAPGVSAALTTLNVTDQEISNLVLPASVELIGTVAVEGGAALPTAFSTAPIIAAKRPDGVTFTTVVGRDGTFRLPIPEGEYQILAANLPSSLALNSMNYGSTDLLKDSLKLDGKSAVLQIRLILAAK